MFAVLPEMFFDAVSFYQLMRCHGCWCDLRATETLIYSRHHNYYVIVSCWYLSYSSILK